MLAGLGLWEDAGEGRTGGKIEEEKVDVKGFQWFFTQSRVKLLPSSRLQGWNWTGLVAWQQSPKRLFLGNLSPFELVLETLLTGE